MIARCSQVLFPFLLVFSNVSATLETCGKDDERNHPVLCGMMERAVTDMEGLADEMYLWAHENGLIVNFIDNDDNNTAVLMKRRLNSPEIPVVFAHGMGDSCFNSGMQHITKHASELLNGVYATCVATGSSRSEDTKNGYLMSMDDNVEFFARAVKGNPHLSNGFHAIGLSQGNNVIRGYIAKHNDPPVNTFISINGVNAGTGAVPFCRPKYDAAEDASSVELATVCDLLMEQASEKAYSDFAQKHSFQANYWRDPRKSASHAYKTYSQLAQWNNEGFVFNQTLKDNWARTSKFVWIEAEKDEMVWPPAGEQWGAPDSTRKDPFEAPILPMKQTEWYIKDLFGLRSADEAGKNSFESFDGNHLRFSMKEFDSWVAKYLANIAL
eukprot:CAMPEP_0195302620 /NCGR_PEP_ID=MMETSP0707-20130614/31398_1 /TAXON_ID=33640 /ORGANISM="Asterionellopsis glacialis, Strain CCMP134" /LENGTH=382 /DNA_ID=CAMNT_0040365929 /DNA_START=65 /DNA_END=1213 /DNA_ORIENTATION=+